jgi:uncharacterized protein
MSGRATLLAIAFVFLVPAAATASFDGDKARTYVEKTVCADPLLGRLDEALARNYDAMLAADLGATRQSLRNEQFRWLATRNQCGSTQCLVDVYRARVDETCDYGVASGVHPDCMPSEDVLAGIDSCPISEHQLLGAWERTSGTAFHQEIAFASAKDGRQFESWLHERPEIAGGPWNLKNCSILIEHPGNPGLGSRLKVVGFRNGTLTLKNERGQGVTVYRKRRD